MCTSISNNTVKNDSIYSRMPACQLCFLCDVFREFPGERCCNFCIMERNNACAGVNVCSAGEHQAQLCKARARGSGGRPRGSLAVRSVVQMLWWFPKAAVAACRSTRFSIMGLILDLYSIEVKCISFRDGSPLLGKSHPHVIFLICMSTSSEMHQLDCI